MALALAGNGVQVAFNFLDDGPVSRSEARRVLHELREMEVRAYCRSCDVRDSDDAHRFVADTVEELGGVHILVNNAGIGRDGAIWQMEDHEWESVLRTNLDGGVPFHPLGGSTHARARVGKNRQHLFCSGGSE